MQPKIGNIWTFSQNDYSNILPTKLTRSTLEYLITQSQQKTTTWSITQIIATSKKENAHYERSSWWMPKRWDNIVKGKNNQVWPGRTKSYQVWLLWPDVNSLQCLTWNIKRKTVNNFCCTIPSVTTAYYSIFNRIE